LISTDQGEKFLVGVDLVFVFGSEDERHGHGDGVRDHGDGERVDRHRREQLHRRHLRQRQPATQSKMSFNNQDTVTII
jgi:hypothetical protein